MPFVPSARTRARPDDCRPENLGGQKHVTRAFIDTGLRHKSLVARSNNSVVAAVVVTMAMAVLPRMLQALRTRAAFRGLAKEPPPSR